MNRKVEEKLQLLTSKPGVYLFKDHNGKIIYIGKAKNLKKRVSSYFKRRTVNDYTKLELMVRKIEDIETMITGNEIEALLLEANLIKKHIPRYNITMKDDKRYPLIKISNTDDYPGIEIVRKRTDKNASYFGPYTSAKSMRTTVRVINQNFQLRKCKKKLESGKVAGKPCLNYQIGLCLTPCRGRLDKKIYSEITKQVKMFLSGKYKLLIESLEDKMKAQSAKLMFEESAKNRDRIDAILRISEKQRIVTSKFKSQDIFGVSIKGKIASVNILMVREGKVIGQKNYILKRELPYNESRIISEFINQYYETEELIPKELISPAEPESRGLIEKMLAEKGGFKVSLHISPRNRLLLLSMQNAKLKLDEYLAVRVRNRGMRALKKIAIELNLKRPPLIIEGFDVSNIGESYSVGAMVYFKNGLPDKNNYRRFRIKTVKGQDDFAMIKEIVKRRYKRVRDEGGKMPDLILIDGGKGQLNSAVEALKELKLEGFSILSIAKGSQPKGSQPRGNEEIFLPYREKPLLIKENSFALKLIQNVRDESHRFAISYHRKLREKI